MEASRLRHLVAIWLTLIGSLGFAQSGWIQMTNGRAIGIADLPMNGGLDSGIVQASGVNQGSRDLFLSYISTYSGNPQRIMIVPFDNGGHWLGGTAPQNSLGAGWSSTSNPVTFSPIGPKPAEAP